MPGASRRVSPGRAIWPYRQDLEDLAFYTPIVAVDLPRLTTLAEQMAGRHARRSVNWRPLRPALIAAPIVETLSQAAPAGLTCPVLPDAELAVAAGAGALTILIPPVVGEGPERLASLARTTPVRIVCDHFAQVERLAAAMHAAGAVAELLLRVDPGRERIGVRPGPDLKDLAQGVARLPGVRLAGLFVEDRSTAASGVAGLTPEELTGLLRGCRANLERRGQELTVVSIGNLRDLVKGVDDSPATEARTPLPRHAGESLAIVAGVVGRPTRDQAIVEVGHRHLGRTAVMAMPAAAGIRPVVIEEEFTVLHLEGSARDLAIGDVVSLRTRAGVRWPQGTTLLVRDRDRWRVAPRDKGLQL